MKLDFDFELKLNWELISYCMISVTIKTQQEQIEIQAAILIPYTLLFYDALVELGINLVLSYYSQV